MELPKMFMISVCLAFILDQAKHMVKQVEPYRVEILS